MRRILIATVLLLATLRAFPEQPAPCGLTSMKTTTPLLYPPIAKAARVTGNVISLVKFKTSGEVERIDVISGPIMLRPNAETFIRGWQANPYGGPRTCPIVIKFMLAVPGEKPPANPLPSDIQHANVTAEVLVISDPAAVLGRRKRLWIF